MLRELSLLLKVGDRVAGFNYGGSFQTDNGSYDRLYAAVTFKIPNELSYEEGAALFLALCKQQLPIK
ncbi:hypothetical protein BT96DRAFT_1004488 [Gymnopus androsaceus JB14]|uniref:Uncharacterized protein n=1 Tax=Gymnopus androsaceus JB14 TaxID=1447944 RepID=A0A6A4GSD1_9AGAR|nr:hypothetical protein BT96DRAFT_1004488 [Gymnopus androsaceus JB14]